MEKFICRNDDVNVHTSYYLLKKFNDLLKSYGLKHYAAILFEDLFKNYEVAHLLVKEPNIVPCFHGWSHLSYGKMKYEEIVPDIKKSLAYWNENAKRRYDSNKKIEIALPTWHLVNDDYKRAAKDCGLKLDTRKELHEGVIMTHWWSLADDESFNNFKTRLDKLA